METFQDLLKWYNNKDIVQNLGVLQKNDEILSPEKNWHVELRFHLTKLSQSLLPLVNLT